MKTKEKTTPSPTVIPEEIIGKKIFIIRGQKVMLDNDLAELYEVGTKVLNQAVKRNLARFPIDFMFQLTIEEMQMMDSYTTSNLRSQIVTSSLKHGGKRYLSYAFTEHGVAMLSAILKSSRAVAMSILIVRTFIKIREFLSTNKELAEKIDELERNQKNHDKQISTISSVVKKLITKQPQRKLRLLKRNKIGFRTTD